MAWPDPSEVAVLTVGGRDYKEWESVSVKHEKQAQPPALCRFTCSEGAPFANNLAKLQIRPGMSCTVTLGGQLAFTGEVMTRQVYYDANRHHIEIQAGSFADLSTSSVIHKGSEFKDKSIPNIMQSVLGKFGYNLKFEGGSPPDDKHPRISVAPTEGAHDFLDVLARHMKTQTGRSAQFGSNPQGDFVVFMAPGGMQGSVVEGRNILIGREIIYNQAAGGTTPVISQGPGTDKKWGAEVAHVPFVKETMQFLSGKSPPSVVFSELPTSEKQVMQSRGNAENSWLAGDEITVTVTVRKWQRDDGGLWEINKKVSVYSPMLMMNGDVLEAKSVTFTQDNKTGTRTTLVLCNDLAMSGSGGGVK